MFVLWIIFVHSMYPSAVIYIVGCWYIQSSLSAVTFLERKQVFTFIDV